MADGCGTASGRMRVLVADDNRDAADSLGVLLRLWGYEAVVTYDGSSAMEAASAHAPHCMILDICMPHLDGYTVARRVREHPELGRAKLVALSAFGSPDHQRRAREAGFDYQIVKPASPPAVEELLNMIEQVMEVAARTKQLTQENVELARETKQVIQSAKADLTEMKERIAGMAEGLREVQQELREVKDAIRQPRGGAA